MKYYFLSSPTACEQYSSVQAALLFTLGAHSLPSSYSGHVPAMSLIAQPQRPQSTFLCSLSVENRYKADGVHTEPAPTCCMKNSVELTWSASLCSKKKLYLNYLHKLNFISGNFNEALRALSCTSRILILHILFSNNSKFSTFNYSWINKNSTHARNKKGVQWFTLLLNRKLVQLSRKERGKKKKIMADLGNFTTFSCAEVSLIRRESSSAADERAGSIMKFKNG